MDPFKELGVSKSSSTDEIKQAYRKLVLQYHPDRHASSSGPQQEAAAARFKVITEAYDILTDERARSAYQASSSSARASYHHNVNTDWSQAHYTGGSGYTSRMSRWELYRRVAKQGIRSFGQTLHLGLAVLLVGGGLMFEYSHTALWQARNKGKSFEEMQSSVRAQQESKANSSSSSSSSSEQQGSSSSDGGKQKVWHLHSSWADGMRGRFVSDSEADAAVVAAPAAADQSAAAARGSR